MDDDELTIFNVERAILTGEIIVREFHATLSKIWADVCELSKQYKLVRIFEDKIGSIG